MDARRKEIGRRLKAYRRGSGLKAEEIARRLSISRSALYRMEAGEIVKIETLDTLAQVLNTSLASLLGVGVEYYSKAGAYFERMHQLEAGAEQVIARFMPVSFLLTTAEYSGHLRQMLIEALPPDESRSQAVAEIDTIMAILSTRKSARKPPRVTALMSVPEVEHFLQLGVIGRFGLPYDEWIRRRAAARREIENITRLLLDPQPGIEVGLIDEMLPTMTFQLFRSRRETVLAVSPFRLSEMPNIRYGVATVTAAPEAVALYEKLAADLWSRALKGPRAAARLVEVTARAAGDNAAEIRLTRAPSRRRKSPH
ncbi:MAG: helix-turn-helix transcriptional regulator [Alphaproteobacteria bacterium]|nr:helix-turn-helix transcriptional regulator [Alphaproteobacteria bacterium]